MTQETYSLQVFRSTINTINTINTLYSSWTQVGESPLSMGKPMNNWESQSLTPPPHKLLNGHTLQSTTHRTSQQQVYVVDKLKSKLSTPAITALNLAAQFEATTEECNPLKQFQNIFNGLGNFSKEFIIKTQTRCNSTCTLHVSPYTTTSPTGSTRRAQMNGVLGCQIES